MATTQPERAWLVRGGRVLASLEIPTCRRDKAKGLLGRSAIDGAMLIRGTRSVHTVAMGFDLDVAFLDRNMTVIRTLRLHRNRVTLPVWRARAVLEAEAGSFSRWELNVGDEVEIRWAEPDS